MATTKSFGTILKDNSTVLEISKSLPTLTEDMLPAVNVPDKFDGRNVWYDYFTPIGLMMDCGRGWLFACVEALSSRYNIYTPYQRNVLLTSIQPIYCPDDSLSPDIPINKNDSSVVRENCAICTNSVYYALKYLFVHGAASTNCVIYEDVTDPKKVNLKSACDYKDFKAIEGSCEKIFGSDRDTCVNEKRAKRNFRASMIANVEAKESTIKKEIFKWGPVVASYLVYDDFVNEYDGLSIYQGPKKDAKLLGGHSGKIVGWGEEKGIPYWIMSNSWSPDWGNAGFFKMKRGSNVCLIEDNVITLYPEILLSYKLYPLPLVIDQELLQKRASIKIDPLNYYTITTIEKIKKEKVTGQLSPYFNPKLMPNMITTNAGEIQNAPLLYVGELKKSKLNILMIVGVVVLGLIIGFFLGKLLTSLIKKKE